MDNQTLAFYSSMNQWVQADDGALHVKSGGFASTSPVHMDPTALSMGSTSAYYYTSHSWDGVEHAKFSRFGAPPQVDTGDLPMSVDGLPDGDSLGQREWRIGRVADSSTDYVVYVNTGRLSLAEGHEITLQAELS